MKDRLAMVVLLMVLVTACKTPTGPEPPPPPPPPTTNFSLSQLSVTFPSTTVNTMSSSVAVVTLKNIGSASIQLSSVARVNSTEFPHTTSCAIPGTLSAGASCTFTVQFRPTSSGTRSGQLTVTTSNAGSGVVTFSGTGGSTQTALLDLSQLSAVMPVTTVGSTSSTIATLTLKSVGTAAVQMSSITSSNATEFPITTTCSLPGSLSPGASCTVTIRFKPSAAGSRSSTVTVSTSNAGSGSLAVSGTGVK